MIPYKEKSNGMIRHTTVLLILLCFSGSCFSFLQESRRKIDSPFSEYHRQASLKEEPRKIVSREREVVVLSPYIRDVGADSRQSRIDARDIRTDFREIRTELGTDTSHSGRRTQTRDSRRRERREENPDTRERRNIENFKRNFLDHIRSREVRSSDSESRLNKYNERTASNNIRFRERRDSGNPNSNRLSERRDSRLEQEYSRRNSLNNIRSRGIRDNNYSIDRRRSIDDSRTRREYTRLSQGVSSRERGDTHIPNNIRFREVSNRRTSPHDSRERREYRLEQENSRRSLNSVRHRISTESRGQRQYRLDQEASRRHSNDIRFRESGINEYSAERRTGEPYERIPIDIRNTQFRTDRENSRTSSGRSRLNNIREREIRSINPGGRIEFRSDGESSRRNLLNNFQSTDRRTNSREENASRSLLSNIRSRIVPDRTRTIPSESIERRESRMRQVNSRNNIRLKEIRDDIRTSRNISPGQSRQRRELRINQENSRRLNIRARAGISSDELNEHRENRLDRSNFRVTNNRRTIPRDSRERRDSRENVSSNIRSRRTSLDQDRDARMDRISGRRTNRSDSRGRRHPQDDKVLYSRENSDRRNSPNEDSLRLNTNENRNQDHRNNDTGFYSTRNTENTKLATKNYDFIPSFNYKSSILITAAQAALVIMLFGQILGNASKTKLRLTNWRAIFGKEKVV